MTHVKRADCGRADGRPARPHHGAGERQIHRLGHRPRAGGPGGGTRLLIPGRGAEEAGGAARPAARVRHRAALRRGRHGLGRCAVRRTGAALGQARLPRPRHRLLGQGGAARPLRRHQPRQLPDDDGHLRLFLHRRGAARRRDDARGRQPADADLLRRRAGHAALQRDGRRQGRARGVGALSRRGPRQGRHPRQRHLGRADQDARRLGDRRFPLHHALERAELAPAPQRDHRGRGQVRALSAVGPRLGRHG